MCLPKKGEDGIVVPNRNATRQRGDRNRYIRNIPIVLIPFVVESR
jgi:hypothetical protein